MQKPASSISLNKLNPSAKRRKANNTSALNIYQIL